MATTVVFSESEIQTIRQAALNVWNDIAYDAIDSLAAAQGKNPETYTLSRAAVLELVLDADRTAENLSWLTVGWEPAARADLLHRWRTADYAQHVRIVKPAFPYARWGL